MAPPNKAIVLSIDEKRSIQSLERAQGCIKLPNGRALTGHCHGYKRNGTTAPLANLDVTTGQPIAKLEKRRHRKEFLSYIVEVVEAHPATRLEVILDKLNGHIKNDERLTRHPLVTFH